MINVCNLITFCIKHVIKIFTYIVLSDQSAHVTDNVSYCLITTFNFTFVSKR